MVFSSEGRTLGTRANMFEGIAEEKQNSLWIREFFQCQGDWVLLDPSLKQKAVDLSAFRLCTHTFKDHTFPRCARSPVPLLPFGTTPP